jgi:hypothetical protein
VTDTGFGRLLTALHCGDCDIAWKDGHHDPLTNGGTDVDCHARDDSQLIDPIGGTDGWVHGGPWDATSTNSRYHLKVAAATSSFFGEFVCSSGANSGEHCGTLSTKNSNIVTWGCGSGTCHGWQASKPGSPPEANVVGGDSGGPVYHPRDDGRVGARGVIWGGAINGSCGSVRFAVTNCFKEVWFNDIVDITTYDWTTVTVETTP